MTKAADIMAAATPGPWESHTFGHRSVRQAAGAVTRALFDVPVPEDVRALMTDLTWVQTDDRNIALTGNGPKQTENARAIVTAVNLFPLYEAVREAAHVVCDPMVEDGGGDRWWEAHDRLRAALDALQAAEDAL